ncbi:MAG: hypothetical protein ACRDNF_12140 [Streptosporangiaceae bacterium]
MASSTVIKRLPSALAEALQAEVDACIAVGAAERDENEQAQTS